MNDLVEHRERSDRFQLLNGEWKFQYYNSIYDVTESFYEKGYDVSGFDQVTVPGVWQMDGYDTHQYTNIRYPFPFDPPYVPQDIPCGAYVHNFEYYREKKASKAFLNFEGVDSCFYVWVNGAYAGYSQVPHATSEFDVTDLLNDGENTLAVLVLKWCDGSYLEDQDKFRMSGIFRDVYLLKRPEKTIRDYYITTDVEKDSVVVKLDMHFAEPVETKVTIEDKYGAVVARGETAENGVLELTVLNPVLWNAENPYLYQVILTMPDEVIVDRIGFRTIEIKDKVVYFNGEKIKFRGVNRHDSDPETGFVIDAWQIKKDLMLMKQHNFNAIRSSHYPNAPYFYQMCDEYGFMVIDEADIEAHGPFMLYRKEDTDQNRFHRWNEKIADDPAWEKAIVDRVQLMVQRDKNRPTPVREDFNLTNLLINLITENAPALEAKGISPVIGLPDHSVYLHSDYGMVERIFQNLIINAIRYSSGSIKIDLKQGKEKSAIFIIENPIDSKVEIDPNRLFERFYTGDKSRHNSGTGVGLAVVKLLTDKLGGNVFAKIENDTLTISLEIK